MRQSTRVKQKSRRKADADGNLYLDQAGNKTKPANPVNKTKESVSTGHTEPAELMAYAVVVSNVKGRRPLDEPDPLNYVQARRSSNSELWVIAEQEEIQSLEENHTWKLVIRPATPNRCQLGGFTRPSDLPTATTTRLRQDLLAEATARSRVRATS